MEGAWFVRADGGDAFPMFRDQRLVEDRIMKNKDVEPASELLKRIRIERRKKWKEAELAKLNANESVQPTMRGRKDTRSQRQSIRPRSPSFPKAGVGQLLMS